MFSFNDLLVLFTGLLLLLVIFSFINEKTIKLPYEIGLVVFGFGFSIVLIISQKLNIFYIPDEIMTLINEFNFNDFLIHGVLCFMLFSGASSIKFNDFNEDKFLIGTMAILGTMVSTVIYSFLFWGLCNLVHMNVSLLESLILGSIVAPTDPISAMSILSKVGLPKRLALIVEGESLFNDGVAVAIFATLMSILEKKSMDLSITGFIWGLTTDVLGAVITGVIISVVFFQIFKYSHNKYIKVFTSILTVTLSYLSCEYLGFSGPIAAVICGLYYASGIAKLQKEKIDDITQSFHDLFYDFWKVIDNLLNGMLFLIVGLLFVNIKNYNILTVLIIIEIGIGAILINMISRSVGVFSIVLFIKKLPLGMKKSKFITFFTWAGLKGGLCLALVMGTGNALSSENYNLILVSTYGIVLFTTVFQGLTVGKVYTKLK